jgi:hypothetical protein
MQLRLIHHVSDYVGFRNYQDVGSDLDAQSFLVSQIINRLATTAIVKVVKVSNAGEVAPVGTVDIICLVNQVDGDGNPTEHGIIHNVPYFRLQGGTNAIILDPQVGDVGISVFCSRDISAVKRTKSSANPGSSRKYDWSDALYVGGILNGAPSQYVRFTQTGINVVSPTKITLNAPVVEIAASTSMNVTTPVVNGDVRISGALTNNAHDVGSGHRHTASGGTGVGGPPQ